MRRLLKNCHAIGRELNLAALRFDRFLKRPRELAEQRMIYLNVFEGVSDTQSLKKTLRGYHAGNLHYLQGGAFGVRRKQRGFDAWVFMVLGSRRI